MGRQHYGPHEMTISLMHRLWMVEMYTHAHVSSEFRQLNWSSFLLLSVNEHLMMCVQLFAYPYQLHRCLFSHADIHIHRLMDYLVQWWLSIEIVMINRKGPVFFLFVFYYKISVGWCDQQNFSRSKVNSLRFHQKNNNLALVGWSSYT